MIICNQCGSSMDESLRFCAECGAEKPTSFQSDAQPTMRLDTGLHQSAIASPVVTGSGTPRANRPAFTFITAILGGMILLVLGGIGSRLLLNRSGGKDLNSAQTPAMTTTPAPATELTAPQSSNITRAQPVKMSEVNHSSLKQEVVDTLNAWAAAANAHDLNAHMRYYADTLDNYFGRQGVRASYVQADLARAYTRYYKINIQLNNLAVTIDPSGTTATVIFDKKYYFTGDKVLSGSVQQMVRLNRSTGQWRITDQKDLRVYYTNK
jgi:hypothetical protein